MTIDLYDELLRHDTSQRYLNYWHEEEIGKTVSRAKAQRAPRFGEISKVLSLRAWRLGAIHFPGVVLCSISKVSIYWESWLCRVIIVSVVFHVYPQRPRERNKQNLKRVRETSS